MLRGSCTPSRCIMWCVDEDHSYSSWGVLISTHHTCWQWDKCICLSYTIIRIRLTKHTLFFIKKYSFTSYQQFGCTVPTAITAVQLGLLSHFSLSSATIVEPPSYVTFHRTTKKNTKMKQVWFSYKETFIKRIFPYCRTDRYMRLLIWFYVCLSTPYLINSTSITIKSLGKHLGSLYGISWPVT